MEQTAASVDRSERQIQQLQADVHQMSSGGRRPSKIGVGSDKVIGSGKDGAGEVERDVTAESPDVMERVFAAIDLISATIPFEHDDPKFWGIVVLILFAFKWLVNALWKMFLGLFF